MSGLREGLPCTSQSTNPVPQVTSPLPNSGQTSRRQGRSSNATWKSEPSPVPVSTVSSNLWPELGGELHGTRCEIEMLISAGPAISVPPPPRESFSQLQVTEKLRGRDRPQSMVGDSVGESRVVSSYIH